MFPLPEVHIGEVWKPSIKQCSLGNRGAFDRQYIHWVFTDWITQRVVWWVGRSVGRSVVPASPLLRVCQT